MLIVTRTAVSSFVFTVAKVDVLAPVSWPGSEPIYQLYVSRSPEDYPQDTPIFQLDGPQDTPIFHVNVNGTIHLSLPLNQTLPIKGTNFCVVFVSFWCHLI